MSSGRKSTVTSIEGYLVRHNADNLDYKTNYNLNDFKEDIYDLLSNENEPLFQFLQNLPRDKATTLLAALITNDREIISAVLKDKLIEAKIDITHLNRLTEFSSKPVVDRDDEGEEEVKEPLVNNTVLQIFDVLIKKYDSVMSLAIFMQEVVQKIHDDNINPYMKYRVIKSMNEELANLLSNYCYTEQLNFSLGQRYSGDITDQEYHVAINEDKLDKSEFILITLGLLQKKFPEEKFIDVRRYYFETNYELALLKLIENIQQLNLDPALAKAIIDKISSLKEPNVYQNYSRRFYENRIAELYYTSVDAKSEFKSISKISGEAVRNPTEAVNAVLSVFIKDRENENGWKRYDQFIEESKLYLSSSAYDKKQYSRKGEEKKGIIRESVYSSNLGVMVSNQPNFPLELSTQALRNRVSDRVSTSEEQENPLFGRAAFVGGLSGHTYWLVGILEDYIIKKQVEQKEAGPELTQDVNTFIKNYVIAYISNGYHGLHETLAIFREPEIMNIFSGLNVPIDLSWSSKLLDQASKDSQEYAKMVVLKRDLHHELVHETPDLKTAITNKPPVFDETKIDHSIEMTIQNKLYDLLNFILYPGEKKSKDELRKEAHQNYAPEFVHEILKAIDYLNSVSADNYKPPYFEGIEKVVNSLKVHLTDSLTGVDDKDQATYVANLYSEINSILLYRKQLYVVCADDVLDIDNRLSRLHNVLTRFSQTDPCDKLLKQCDSLIENFNAMLRSYHEAKEKDITTLSIHLSSLQSEFSSIINTINNLKTVPSAGFFQAQHNETILLKQMAANSEAECDRLKEVLSNSTYPMPILEHAAMNDSLNENKLR